VACNGAYCVSKAGVWMLTKCLALELGSRGVRVNSVSPGFVITPMSQDIQDDQGRLSRLLESIPAGRMGTVEDIAEVVTFLASETASYMTGCMLGVDGGSGANGRSK
jgi:NAD(P)-dependent dehydrogenase (short-subunit alcohol dehydrogenase family)